MLIMLVAVVMEEKNMLVIECLCHTKGTWAGKPFELIDWQEQIIRDIGKIGTCGCSGTASDLWRWRRER